MEELKDFTYEQLVNYVSGHAIMWLGEGKSIHTIMSLAATYIFEWKYQQDLRTKKDEKTN